MTQFQIIDINRWWRTGGANYTKLLQNSEHIIIQACAGNVVNELLEEQIAGVLAAGGDYETYGIPAANMTGESWADFYMDLPGVMEAPKYIDREPTGGAQASLSVYTKARARINSKSAGPAGYYSNSPYTTADGVPPWIFEDDVWWAEYPLHWVLPKYVQYGTFEEFFNDKSNWSGRWSAKLGITPIMIQFSEKGRAQLYGANPYTQDPDHKVGIQSANLSAGLITYGQYWSRRFGPYKEDPPIPNPDMAYVLAKLADHEKRISTIEGNQVPSPGEPDPEPEPAPPSPDSPGSPYVVRASKTVAWEQTGSGGGGPIFETNAYIKYNDPQLKWEQGDTLRLYRPAVNADGGKKYLKCASTPAIYGALYVKQEDVMKLD